MFLDEMSLIPFNTLNTGKTSGPDTDNGYVLSSSDVSHLLLNYSHRSRSVQTQCWFTQWCVLYI